MVFSFFKKPPEKMVARPAATPRPAAPSRPTAASRPVPLHERTSTRSETKPRPADKPARSSSPAPASVAADPTPSSLEAADFVFSESSPDFQIEGEIDPIDAEAEKAAVLYANGQDEAVHAGLENAVRVHRAGAAERLWLILFDLYRMGCKEAAFAALGVDYARSFEKPPPSWGERRAKPEIRTQEVIPGAVLFHGNLTGDNAAAFDAIRQMLDDRQNLRLDLESVSIVDAQGCGRLLTLLQQAAKAKRELELFGREKLGTLVERHVVSGRAEDKECWLLMLELCQLQDWHEAFDEVAIDYAVTFEVSPPSWEAERVAAPEPARESVSVTVEPELELADLDVATDAYALRGNVKAMRFTDLSAYAEMHDAVVIDCTALTRIDFISAGALLNALSTVRRTGKQIIFRHPNRLVAELFGVVGLTAIATIVFAKH